MFDWESFVKATPPHFGACNFFTSNPFLSIFSATNALEEELHLLFEHHKQWAVLQKDEQIVTEVFKHHAIYPIFGILGSYNLEWNFKYWNVYHLYNVCNQN